jgi:hypothetical protein
MRNPTSIVVRSNERRNPRSVARQVNRKVLHPRISVRPSCSASDNPEESFERTESASDSTLSNVTVHRRLAVQDSLIFHLICQGLAEYGLDCFRQQFRIVLVDVRQLDREVYRPAVIDVSPTQRATLAATGAVETGHGVSAGKQGRVQAPVHTDPAEHGVQQSRQAFPRFLKLRTDRLYRVCIERGGESSDY